MTVTPTPRHLGAQDHQQNHPGIKWGGVDSRVQTTLNSNGLTERGTSRAKIWVAGYDLKAPPKAPARTVEDTIGGSAGKSSAAKADRNDFDSTGGGRGPRVVREDRAPTDGVTHIAHIGDHTYECRPVHRTHAQVCNELRRPKLPTPVKQPKTPQKGHFGRWEIS